MCVNDCGERALLYFMVEPRLYRFQIPFRHMLIVMSLATDQVVAAQ